MLPNRRYSGFSSAILDKKVEKNPRYKDVRPVVNSGNTVAKYIDTLKEYHKHHPYMSEEIFKRIKLSVFVKLIIAFAKNSFGEDPIVDFGGTLMPAKKPAADGDSVSCLLAPFQGVLIGIGELDRKKQKNEEAKVSTLEDKLPPPYLLLDVRDSDEYNSCHIITAKNYPASRLSRSMSYETKDLLNYKNVSQRLIVFYDEEEIIAQRVAKTLIQRGYNNVFVLSGGLKMAQEKFPRGLINGVFIQHMPNDKKNVPLKSPLSTTESPKPAFKDSFTEEDIYILQQALDNLLTTSKETTRVEGVQSRLSIRTARSSSSSTKRPWK